MTIEEIKKIIFEDESRILELKKSTGELKDGMKSACAFLNSDGGWVVFGVTPVSLNLVGQQVTDNTLREISREITKIEPAIELKPEYIDIDDKPGYKLIVLRLNAWLDSKEMERMSLETTSELREISLNCLMLECHSSLNI